MIQARYLEQSIGTLESEIGKLMKPYEEQISRLLKIPGVKLTTAHGIIAEATIHMEHFPTDRHFAAWAGVAPGNYQSAGKRRRTRTRHGNPAFKKILIQLTRGAVKKKESCYRAKYIKLTMQLGSKNKALVAIANRIARVIYHLLSTPGLKYRDIGPQRVNGIEQQIKRKIGQLKALGLEVQYIMNQKIVVQKHESVTV